MIIEVLKKKGVVPRKLVELYEKQVEGIMSRCIHRPLKTSASSCLRAMTGQGRTASWCRTF